MGGISEKHNGTISSINYDGAIVLKALAADSYDPAIKFRIGNTPTVQWNMGIDNSDGDKFKLGFDTGGDLGTSVALVSDGNTWGMGSSAVNQGNSVLNLISTTRGLTVPRMTTAQRNTLSGAIAGSISGCIIFNITTGKLEVYNGTTGFEAITSTGP